MHLGSWKIDDIVTIPANTHSPSTGSESDADAAPTYRVYENITTTPILTGTMALLDDTNTTGFYAAQITLSAANGFEKGKSYSIRVSATVGSKTQHKIYTLQVEAEVSVNSITTPGATDWSTKYLKFDESTIASGEALHSPLNAHRAVRRAAIVGLEMIVYKADGSEAFRVPVTTANVDELTSVGKP